MLKSDSAPGYAPIVGMPAPKDVGRMAYMIMFYEGVGNLFPWNAFITASSYYAQRFCGTSFESTFENYFSITYTLSQTIGLALAVRYQDRLSMNQKVTIPLVFYSAIFAFTTMLVIIQNMDSTLLFFLTLISAFLAGNFGALLSGGLFSLGAMLPAEYTGALMNGQGLAGLIVSVSALLTQLASSPIDDCDDDAANDDDCAYSLNYSALAYFLIATLILAVCILAFAALKRLEFTRYYMARAMGEGDEDILNPILSGNDAEQDESPVGGVLSGKESAKSDASSLRIGGGDETSLLSQATVSNEKPPVTMESILNTYRKIAIPSLSVWGTFGVTIGLFPALTVLIESTDKCKTDNRLQNDLFVPIMFLLFNLFDLAGRLLAGWVQNIFTARNIWMGSVARLIFVPAFLLCNISDSQLPVVFDNDAFPYLFMILFAVTNGYIASTCMMLGPSLVPVQETSLAGTIMVFSLTCGLLTGACVSFLTVFIAKGSL